MNPEEGNAPDAANSPPAPVPPQAGDGPVEAVRENNAASSDDQDFDMLNYVPLRRPHGRRQRNRVGMIEIVLEPNPNAIREERPRKRRKLQKVERKPRTAVTMGAGNPNAGDNNNQDNPRPGPSGTNSGRPLTLGRRQREERPSSESD